MEYLVSVKGRPERESESVSGEREENECDVQMEENRAAAQEKDKTTRGRLSVRQATLGTSLQLKSPPRHRSETPKCRLSRESSPESSGIRPAKRSCKRPNPRSTPDSEVNDCEMASSVTTVDAMEGIEDSNSWDTEENSEEEEQKEIEEVISDDEIPEDQGVTISDWASFGDYEDVSKLTKEVVDRSGGHKSFVKAAAQFLPGRYVVTTMKWTQFYEEDYHEVADCALIHHEDYDVKELLKTRSPDIRVQYKRRYSWHENRYWGFCKRLGTFFINPDFNSEVMTAKARNTSYQDIFLLKTSSGVNMGFRIETYRSTTYIGGDWIGGLMVFLKDGRLIGLSINDLFSDVDDDIQIVPEHWFIE